MIPEITLNDIELFDIEITTDCNAACPQCARELFKDKLVKQHITLKQFQNAFTPNIINGKTIELSGVWGDPVKHPECLEILEYIVKNNCKVYIDTNGGYQTAEWWSRLGKVANTYNNRLQIRWSIDGHKETNHIYRRNTKFDIIIRNMNSYLESANAPKDHNIWSFILFEHNLHELEIARQHAKKVGLRFQTRQSHRSPVKITNQKNSELSNIEPVVHDVVPGIQEVENFKNCRLYHGKQIFVGSDYKVWPCCFIWDEVSRNKKNILEKFKIFDQDWNNLDKHSLNDIIQHEYYQKILKESWNQSHSMHLDRCVSTCFKNKINVVTNEYE